MEELPVTHPDFGKWRRGLRVNDPDARLARYASSPEVIAKPIEAEPEPEIQPLGYEDEAPDLAAENEALRAEVETLRKELEARDAPVGLPPNPSETKLSDYGPVGDEAGITSDDLVDFMKKDQSQEFTETQSVISKLSRERRRRFTEILNVEKAELRNKAKATGVDDPREADVDRLLNLFARVGEA